MDAQFAEAAFRIPRTDLVKIPLRRADVGGSPPVIDRIMKQGNSVGSSALTKELGVGAEVVMPVPSEYSPLDRTPWLLAIGERLRAEYDSLTEPLPERLAVLIAQLEILAGMGTDARHAASDKSRSAD
jgi:hypothetical protein